MNKEIGQNIISKKIRYDLEIIANLVKENSEVLDIGCGEGELLYFLKHQKNANCRGLEISQEKVSKALMRGLSVIQGNADEDLHYYPNQTFTYTILSQTLQATNKPKEVLKEMLRISKYAIISLPNFAHYKNRLHLALKGTMPVNKNIPFQWYETPNIHFCSIKDFEKLCADLNFKIEQKIFLNDKIRLPSLLNKSFLANIFAQYGIFLISKKEFAPTANEEMVFKKADFAVFNNPILSNFSNKN
jgi:methionine biosynthesis protein MetW